MISNSIINSIHNCLNYEIFRKLNGKRVSFTLRLGFEDNSINIFIIDNAEKVLYDIYIFDEVEFVRVTFIKSKSDYSDHIEINSNELPSTSVLDILGTVQEFIKLVVDDINAPTEHKILKW